MPPLRVIDLGGRTNSVPEIIDIEDIETPKSIGNPTGIIVFDPNI